MHILHDGYTDELYALLPVWQAQFGLSYMGLAIVRALYFGTMGGLQVPVDRWTSRLKPRSALALSTLVAAAGFVAMALPTGFIGLCAGLVLAGVGSSLQHPRASQLVTRSYGSESRPALGIYNFAATWEKPPFLQLLLFYYRFCHGEPSLGLWEPSGFSSHPVSLRLYRRSLPSLRYTRSSSVHVKAAAVSACCSLSAFLIQQRAWAISCFFRSSSMHAGIVSDGWSRIGAIVRWRSVWQGELWLARSARRRGWERGCN